MSFLVSAFFGKAMLSIDAAVGYAFLSDGLLLSSYAFYKTAVGYAFLGIGLLL